MVRALFGSIIVLAAFAACGGDDAEPEGPTPELPGRDAAPPPLFEASTCDTANDPANCGACGNVCPSGLRGTAACVRGACVLACEAGFGDCNGSPFDGCETDVRDAVAHCGACGRDCRACGGSTCVAGACDAQTVLTRPAPITQLTVDAERITFADAASVDQAPRSGGAVSHVYDVAKTPWLLADGAIVYFVVPGREGFAGIYATSAGFVGPQIAAFARGQNVDTFARDDTGVYWAAETTLQARELVRCKDCTVPTVLSPSENELRPGAIALDATTVFFGSGDMIRRVEKTAEGLRTLVVGQSARALAVDADSIYWLNEEAQNVVRLAKTGGTPEVLLPGLTVPRSLVLAGGQLYVGDRSALVRLDTDGRGRLELARAPDALGPVAVDGACVFYGAGSEIRRVSR